MAEAGSMATDFSAYLHTDDSLVFPDLPLTLKTAHFDTQRYRDEFFRQHGLHLPAQRRGAVQKRRSEFFAGRYLAKLALLEAGAAHFDVPADPRRCPLWPAGFCGSISHTDSFAACAIGATTELAVLGIDLQDWLTGAAAEKLARRILAPTELAILAMEDIPLSTAVSLCFSAKESIFKGLYPYIGKHFGFAAARLVAIDTESRQLQFHFDETLRPDFLPAAPLPLHYQLDPVRAATLLALPAGR